MFELCIMRFNLIWGAIRLTYVSPSPPPLASRVPCHSPFNSAKPGKGIDSGDPSGASMPVLCRIYCKSTWHVLYEWDNFSRHLDVSPRQMPKAANLGSHLRGMPLVQSASGNLGFFAELRLTKNLGILGDGVFKTRTPSRCGLCKCVLRRRVIVVETMKRWTHCGHAVLKHASLKALNWFGLDQVKSFQQTTIFWQVCETLRNENTGKSLPQAAPWGFLLKNQQTALLVGKFPA